MIALLWIALSPVGASELCAEVPADALDTAVAQVDTAYRSMDEAAFDRSAKQLEAVTSCLDTAPPGTSMAHLHQAMALIAFVNGQKTAARRAMEAARLTDPSWKLDVEIFPEGHPYRQIWLNATDPGPAEPLGVIAPRVWLIDGAERDDAPVERAFLVQIRNEERKITSSEYLYDREDLPDYGQETRIPGWITPRMAEVAALVDLRFLNVDQGGSGAGVSPQDETAVGAGIGTAIRFTPISFVGVELRLNMTGGADPVLRGTFGVEGEAIGLFGAGFPVSELGQAYANLRVGYARDSVIGWVEGVDDGLTQTVFSLNTLLVGAEGGFRGKTMDLRLSLDSLLSGASGLYELRVGAVGAVRLSKPVALQFGLSGRTASLGITDGQDREIGARRDVELRAEIGPALWFE